MPKVTVSKTEARSNASSSVDYEYDHQDEADNKFAELVADYNTKVGYVKTIDDLALKVYTFLNSTTTITNE